MLSMRGARFWMWSVGCALLFASGTAARAEVLDFSGFGLPNGSAIPQTYGDNLPGTPNITVSYRAVDVNDNNNTTGPDVYYWSTGYGDLTDVAFPLNFHLAEITFTAEPGFAVRLVSFDLGAIFQGLKLDQTVRVLDGSFGTLVDYSPWDIQGVGGHDSFTPNVTAQTIRIQFGPSFDDGIDNIVFEQVAVPEPTSVALGGMALFGLGMVAWKRRRV